MAEDLSKHFYFEHREDYEPAALRKRFSDRKLEVKVVKNGIILPARRAKEKLMWEGGVCDKDFNFVAGYTRRNPQLGIKQRAFNSVESSYVVDKEEITHIDEDVIFGGVLFGHFGHFILESLTRLWYVLSPPHTQSFSDLKITGNSKILFIVGHFGYRSWFDDFFKLMGIAKERIVYVDKPTQCCSVTVPEQSVYVDDNYMKEFIIPYEAIKANVTPGNVKKVYLSRRDMDYTQQGSSRIHNEQYFEDFFVSHGFKSVEIEKLSIEEQISIVMGADEVAAGIGTLTHWALFCGSNIKFVMLISRLNKYFNWQILINEAKKVKAYIIDCSKSLLPTRGPGEYLFKTNKQWKKFVTDYFDEYIEEDDDYLFFDKELEKYVSSWVERYARQRDLFTITIKKLCNQIIVLEKELDKHRPLITYQTHVGKKGWSDWVVEKQLSNSIENNFDIQAVKIDFSSQFCDVYYSVYYGEKEGWCKEVSNIKIAGTVGKFKPIFGIKIRLDDIGKEKYDVWYRFHTFEGKWTSWAKNGEELISPNVKLNSLQIKLENKQKLLFKQIEPGTFTVNN